MQNVITIDGPVASGKGDASKLLADKLGFVRLDSGSIYRTIAYMCVGANIDPKNESAVNEFLVKNLSRITAKNGELFLDNKQVGQEIRTPEIDKITPSVAANLDLRKAIMPLQRQFAQGKGLVAEGRDMSSVLFPDAKLKIYLTASPEIRAKRRFDEYTSKGKTVTLQDTLAELYARDKKDTEGKHLVQTSDSHEIISDHLTQEQVVDTIIDLWKKTR